MICLYDNIEPEFFNSARFKLRKNGKKRKSLRVFRTHARWEQAKLLIL